MTQPTAPNDDPLVRPGTASFRCLADECGALCCRNPYRVDLAEDEAARLACAVDLSEVLDERASIMLILQPDGDACALLGRDLRCRAYEARPNGCRDYPFRLETDERGEARIVRDLACPGFVGPPLTESEYANLLGSLHRRPRV